MRIGYFWEKLLYACASWKAYLATWAGSPEWTALSTAESTFEAASSICQKSSLSSCRAIAAVSNSLEKSGIVSPRSSSLRRMLRARTAAYCTYGPVSPSKLNASRSEEHTSELQSLRHLVCRLLLEKKKK